MSGDSENVVLHFGDVLGLQGVRNKKTQLEMHTGGSDVPWGSQVHSEMVPGQYQQELVKQK